MSKPRDRDKDKKDDERDLTTDEVARVLQLNRATVQRMLLSGRLRGYQIGRSWRVPRAALDEFRGAGVVGERAPTPYGRPSERPSKLSDLIADPEEWLRVFDEVGASIEAPPLSDEALRREVMYEGEDRA